MWRDYAFLWSPLEGKDINNGHITEKIVLEETLKRILIVFIPNKNSIWTKEFFSCQSNKESRWNADKIIFKGFSESHKFYMGFRSRLNHVLKV